MEEILDKMNYDLVMSLTVEAPVSGSFVKRKSKQLKRVSYVSKYKVYLGKLQKKDRIL